MVKRTIASLDDGQSTRTSAAVVAFEEGGAAFKSSIRPNPPHVVIVETEAQLLVAFPNMEIPDDTAITVIIDESFNLTMPIKLGNNVDLELLASATQVTLTYTGTGAMFQVKTPGDIPSQLTLSHIILAGNTTNIVFDVLGSLALSCDFVSFRFFDDFGESAFPILIMNLCGGIFINKGLRLKNLSDYLIESFLTQNGTGTGITWFSILTDSPVDPSVLAMNNVKTRGMFTGDSFIFIPNDNLVDSRFKIENSFAGTAADLYQQGSDIPITLIVNNGNGKLRCTATAHGIPDKRVGTLNGFSEPYNKTSVLTFVDVNTFDAENIDFTNNDSGNVNTKSLDSTSVGVVAIDNPSTPDSMYTGDAGLELASQIEITIANQDEAVAINNANWSYDNLERFEEDLVTTNEGRLIAKDDSTRRYSVTYSATINRSGGGGTNVGIVLLKDDGVTTTIISINPPRAFTTAVTFMTRTEIVELEENDTLQIAVINYNGTDNIDVYQANLSVNRA